MANDRAISGTADRSSGHRLGQDRRPGPPRANQDTAEASNVTAVPPPVEPVTHLSLRNEAEPRGLNFFGRTGDRLDVPGIMLYQTLGCGGGTIDFDRDGWSDLYLVAAGGTPPAKDSADNALMRNLEGRFLNVTADSDTNDRGFGQGVAVGDVNEDGFPDLLVLNYGPNVLMINNGDGTFRDQTIRSSQQRRSLVNQRSDCRYRSRRSLGHRHCQLLCRTRSRSRSVVRMRKRASFSHARP